MEHSLEPSSVRRTGMYVFSKLILPMSQYILGSNLYREDLRFGKCYSTMFIIPEANTDSTILMQMSW